MDIYNKLLLIILGVLFIYSANNLKNFKFLNESSLAFFEFSYASLGSILLVLGIDLLII